MRGVTLVELLVSLALAGMVVAGGLRLHAALTAQSRRSEESAEIQQALRLSMRILERAIRAAGGGGADFVENDSGQCPGPPIHHYGFEWSNRNLYADPIVAHFPAGETDVDPDWFRVLTVDAGGNLLGGDDRDGELAIVQGDVAAFHDGDLMQVLTPELTCLREVSGLKRPAALAHDPSQSSRCFNPKREACLLRCSAEAPCAVRRLAAPTAFRVDLGVPTAVGPATPRLTMRQAPFGTAFDARPWTVIAENIEDLQLALILDDGRVCNHADDPAVCDPAHAVAVRVTLVGRSAAPSAREGGRVGGAEDRPAAQVNDRFLRRALESEIDLARAVP
jgi:hypothetical protein